MQRLIYSVTFYSYWHVGSGLSGGASTNALVLKNSFGLPFIPGRTLKGLLREAAETVKSFHPEFIPGKFIDEVFGPRTEEGAIDKASEYDLSYGSFFGNAELSSGLSSALTKEQNGENLKSYLYHNISSTAISKDGKGQALDYTLRKMQVTIPLTLYAYIDNFPDEEEYIQYMNRCFKWVKRMGVNRNRGLGRCFFELKSKESNG